MVVKALALRLAGLIVWGEHERAGTGTGSVSAALYPHALNILIAAIDRRNKWTMVGSWINCVLLSTEILVSCFYWVTYNRTMNIPAKTLICAMLCNDITQSVLVCGTVYMVRLLVDHSSKSYWCANWNRGMHFIIVSLSHELERNQVDWILYSFISSPTPAYSDPSWIAPVNTFQVFLSAMMEESYLLYRFYLLCGLISSGCF